MTELPKLEDFPVKDFDKIRYGDTDRQGHVNNAVFSTLFETGRTSLLSHSDGNAWKDGQYSYVIARIELDYRAELFWPGIVDIGSGIKSIGNSSMVLSQALYQGGKCAATAVTVMVQLDKQTNRPAPLTPEAREVLEGFMV